MSTKVSLTKALDIIMVGMMIMRIMRITVMSADIISFLIFCLTLRYNGYAPIPSITPSIAKVRYGLIIK